MLNGAIRSRERAKLANIKRRVMATDRRAMVMANNPNVIARAADWLFEKKATIVATAKSA